MKSQMLKFNNGDKVIVGGNISAMITGITITNSAVEYRCGYFIQGIYYAYWLHEYEITPTEKSIPTLIKFGYKEGLKDDNEQ